MTDWTTASALPLLVLMLSAVGWYAVNRALFGDLLSPFSLVFISWIAPVILQTMNLSYYEMSWTVQPALVVVWTSVALAGTCLVTPGYAWSGGPTPAAVNTFRHTLEILRRPAFLLAFFIIYAVAFTTYVYAEFLTNPVGVPLLAVLEGRWSGGALHRWGKDTRWSVIAGLLPVLTPIAYLSSRAVRKGLMRVLLRATTALFPFMAILKLSRSDVFVSVVAVAAAALLHGRFGGMRRSGIRRRIRIAAALGVVMLVLYAMMAMRIASVPVENIYAELIGFRIPGEGPMRGLAAAIYGYVAMPFDNLNRFLSVHDGSLHIGISVFRPFLSVSGLGALADRLDADIYYPAPGTYAAGSATFLTAVYAELGLLGVVAVPIAYALVMNVLYARMRARPTFGNVFLYINFMGPWLWLFFNNGFGVLSVYLNAAAVYAGGLMMGEFWPRHATRGPPYAV